MLRYPLNNANGNFTNIISLFQLFDYLLYKKKFLHEIKYTLLRWHIRSDSSNYTTYFYTTLQLSHSLYYHVVLIKKKSTQASGMTLKIALFQVISWTDHLSTAFGWIVTSQVQAFSKPVTVPQCIMSFYPIFMLFIAASQSPLSKRMVSYIGH